MIVGWRLVVKSLKPLRVKTGFPGAFDLDPWTLDLFSNPKSR
jgi:hypothetical protein